MTSSEFERVSVHFQSDWDPIRLQPLNHSFSKNDFKVLDGDNNLFKLAAHQMITDEATSKAKQL